MDDYDSYHDNDTDNDIDWMSMCEEMTNTIDALNTNIILLNRFIKTAVDTYDCSMNFKENIEITAFDSSGNIMTCVKSDGSGNFLPCVFMDLSCNMIPSAIPNDEYTTNKVNSKRERSFSPLSPYYFPYYSLYNPYYSLYSPYYNIYPNLLDNINIYRDIPVKNMMKSKDTNDEPMYNSSNKGVPYYPPYYRPPYYRPPYYRPPYYRPPYYPPHHRPPHYPPHNRPPYYPIYQRSQCHESMNE
jgi:hypothetical protein